MSGCGGPGSLDAGIDAAACTEECDDGTFCNGVELCQAGVCAAGEPPCEASVCDEAMRLCPPSDCDADGDGHEVVACGGDDCDDDDANRFPENLEVCDAENLDEDCDSTTFGGRDADGDTYDSNACCNRQADGSLACSEDCDDGRRGVNPNAPEVCDTLDNDCNGMIDEGVILTCYVDADGDGYALEGAAVTEACVCPTRSTDRPPTDAADCDDALPDVSPEVPEICSNDRDDDCDEMVDEAGNDWFRDCDGDGAGSGAVVRACTSPGTPVGCPGGGHVLVDDDCDDDDPYVYPGAADRCDDTRNDCHSSVVDGIQASSWCNITFSLPNTTLACGSGGICEVSDCGSGYGDCTAAAGCETDVRSSLEHCGECNHACPDKQWCVASACELIPFTQLRAGTSHTCALRADGRVICWGDNAYGQLGDGDAATSSRWTGVAVTGLTDAVEIATGWQHTCARRASGAVVCWGGNTYGQLGDGTETRRFVPSPVTGLSDAVEIATGREHTCARRASGAVVCWGRNTYGQLGNGTATFGANAAPLAVSDLTDAVEITAGRDFTCARRTSGAVACWGNNDYGKLADGTTAARYTPAPVLGLSDAVELVSGGGHTCARRAAGPTVCWGPNFSGEVGDGSTTPRSAPTMVSGLSDAVELTAGASHTCARRSSGAAVCWGLNASVQLGDGSSTNRAVPTAVVGLTDAAEITAGGSHSCARRATGALVCWGVNGQGQLGNVATFSQFNTPTPVTGI